MCKIIGVLIDNAIEESINIEKREIGIYLHYNNGQLEIIIKNYHNL